MKTTNQLFVVVDNHTDEHKAEFIYETKEEAEKEINIPIHNDQRVITLEEHLENIYDRTRYY